MKKALEYVGDYQLKSACKDAICIAISKVTQMIFAVLVDWYHQIVLTHSCKLVAFLHTFCYNRWEIEDYLLVRPKAIACGVDLSFTPDVFLFFFHWRNLRDAWADRREICTMVSTRSYFIMPIQNFGACTPKKFQGPKTCKIWLDFGRLRSSAANIPETDEYIQNRIFIPSTAIPLALGETSTVKFGPVTLEISMLNRTHPKCIIRKTINRPLGGAAPPNFYTR